MSEFGSFRVLSGWRAAVTVLACVLLSGCGGCGQRHALPDASAAPADASVACQWQLGEPRRLAHALGSLSRSDSSGVPWPGSTGASPGAWLTSRDHDGTWLHHLNVNGDNIVPPILVIAANYDGDLPYSEGIVLGKNGGGLVIYNDCPRPDESCRFGGGLEYETRRVPQLRAFDADGVLGPVQYVDAPGSINERLLGSVAGDGFVVVVKNVVPANSLVQSVSATGALLGPPMRGLFRTEIFDAFPVEPSSAAFVLQPREDGSVWLATLDAAGRPRGEVRTEIRLDQPEHLVRIGVRASRDRIVLTTLDGIYAMTPAGELEWSRATARSIQAPIVVGDTVFLLSSRDYYGPRHWELLRLGDMGSVEESIDLGDLAFNPDDTQGLTAAVSTGSGLLLIEHVHGPYGEPDRDPHVNVYPVRCLPPPGGGDAG